METSEALSRLDELCGERDRLVSHLKRSLALQDWIPDVFKGPARVTHRIVGAPSQGFRFELVRADGTTFVCPLEDVPKGICSRIPVYKAGKIVWEENSD